MSTVSDLVVVLNASGEAELVPAPAPEKAPAKAPAKPRAARKPKAAPAPAPEVKITEATQAYIDRLLDPRKKALALALATDPTSPVPEGEVFAKVAAKVRRYQRKG